MGKKIVYPLFILLMVGYAGNAFAEVNGHVWDGGGDGTSWADPNNWDSDTAMAEGDWVVLQGPATYDVEVPSSYVSPTITQILFFDTGHVANYGSLNFGTFPGENPSVKMGGGTTVGTFTFDNYGTVDVAAGCPMYLPHGGSVMTTLNIHSGHFFVDYLGLGTVVNTSQLNISGGEFRVTGTLEVGPSTNTHIDISDDGQLSIFGDVTGASYLNDGRISGNGCTHPIALDITYIDPCDPVHTLPGYTIVTATGLDDVVVGHVWDGGGDGISWDDPLNWDSDIAMEQGDWVVLQGPATYDVEVPSDCVSPAITQMLFFDTGHVANYGSLSFAPFGGEATSVKMGGGTTVGTFTFDNYGTVDVAAGTPMYLPLGGSVMTTLNIYSGHFFVDYLGLGTIVNSSQLNISGGEFRVTGTLEVGPSTQTHIDITGGQLSIFGDVTNENYLSDGRVTGNGSVHPIALDIAYIDPSDPVHPLPGYTIITATGLDCADTMTMAQGDINEDCLVNLNDFAILGNNWLGCGLTDPNLCP